MPMFTVLQNRAAFGLRRTGICNPAKRNYGRSRSVQGSSSVCAELNRRPRWAKGEPGNLPEALVIISEVFLESCRIPDAFGIRRVSGRC